MLRVTSLKKTAGDFSLCIDAMEIPSNGIYALLGPNGCGKSTLAKVLGGITQAESGVIDCALNCRQTTIITQKPYIMDDTVYNNVLYPLKLRGIQHRHSLCDEYLQKTGLVPHKNKQARLLSGGEKQKLALARALVFDPKLIILDEAMTDLDLDSLDMFENLILQRQKQSPAVWIIISHHLSHIKRLCDYIFL